jgi:two-component system response regulator TrcR
VLLSLVRQRHLPATDNPPWAELLKILAENAFENVDYKDILLKLWGNDGIYASKSLQVFITKLRHKLANDEAINIINVRGEGYKLVY